jgi:hypothetical protein
MTTWNSRIILRHDADWTLDDTANIDYPLARGEVGAQITGEFIDVRVGVASEGTLFSDCISIYQGRIGVESLPLSVEVPEGSGLDDGTVLRWDPATSRFVPDAEPIAFASAVSGSLTYTAATDRWTADASRFIPESLDGGTFIAGGPETVAPSFTSLPSIGEPTP